MIRQKMTVLKNYIFQSATLPTNKNVRVNTPFVSLVYNNHTVLRKKKIGLKLSQEDTVRHELDLSVLRYITFVPGG